MTIVTCAIMEKAGKILIAKRSPDQANAGKWEFPGGKIEEGESPEECLKRELEEEFGIQAEVGEFLASNRHQYGHLLIELMAFHTRYISGSFTLADHDEIRWVKAGELLDFDLAEADISIARELMNHASQQEEKKGKKVKTP